MGFPKDAVQGLVRATSELAVPSWQLQLKYVFRRSTRNHKEFTRLIVTGLEAEKVMSAWEVAARNATHCLQLKLLTHVSHD